MCECICVCICVRRGVKESQEPRRELRTIKIPKHVYVRSVSYTHLDVYKRQGEDLCYCTLCDRFTGASVSVVIVRLP